MYACIVVSLMAGVRPEEARAIGWEEDVDLDGNPPPVAVLRAGHIRKMFQDVCERARLGRDWGASGPAHTFVSLLSGFGGSAASSPSSAAPPRSSRNRLGAEDICRCATGPGHPEPRSYLAEAVVQGLKTFDDDAVGHPLMLEERLKATAN